MTLFVSPLQISDSLPDDAHVFREVILGWRTNLIHFIQYGLPQLLVAFFFALVVQRIASFFIHRMLRRAQALIANSRRAAQLRTIAAILRGTVYAVLAFYLLAQIFAVLGVSVAPFIASAGVIGLGISFGAQSIFKDMLNGIFILIEDQYSVGDTVKVASITGSVEDLTLRVTTLRDGDGNVFIIPNSQITTVSNMSRDFSAGTLSLSVDARQDPDHVLSVLRAVTAKVRSDPAFKDIFLADPDIPGVDNLVGLAVTYPISIRVRVNQRDAVLRELRRRILLAFDTEKIALAPATSSLILQSAPPQPAAN